MPELPDIVVYIEALERIVGQPLEHVRLASRLVVRSTVNCQTLKSITVPKPTRE